MLSLRERFVDLAVGQVGVKEVTPNRSPQILKYRASTTLGVNGVPDKDWAWCSAYCCWVLEQFLTREMPSMLSFRMKSARARDWNTWKYPGVKVSKPTQTLARMGDIITFEFNKQPGSDHVGIVRLNQAKLGDPIMTVEGNTAKGSTARDSSGNTDGVYAMERKPSLVDNIISFLP